jgi:hypothetical protein
VQRINTTLALRLQNGLKMKQFFHQNKILGQAIYSSAIVSLFLYIVVRTFTFEFPMTWIDEALLFIKVVCTGSFMMVLITVGCAGIYLSYQKMKRTKGN